MSWVFELAQLFQTQESGLRLVLGQLLAYPTFIFYRSFLLNLPNWIQHLYIISTGMLISYWSIGLETILHTLNCILITYFMLSFIRIQISSILIFIFNMGYLFIGYYYTASDGYDVGWTMPHCVLCLRLIAIAMDHLDGQQAKENLSNYQKTAALETIPSLFEILSQCWFIGGYFVGPQFSMRKYLNFINRRIQGSLSYGFKRLFIGLLYIAFYVMGSVMVPSDYVTTEEFKTLNFVSQQFWYFVWVKIILSKYIAAWLLAEGSVVISGLGYNGTNDQNEILWNGGANVKLRLYESSTKFAHLIASFNINTNAWVAEYIYKRLKIFNNRFLSQLITLFFLAFWHGLHSGYYLTFFHEFMMIYFEKDFEGILKKNSRIQHLLTHPGAGTLTSFLGRLYVIFALPHCFLPFGLLKWSKYVPVIQATSGILYLIFLPWPLYSFFLKKILYYPEKKVEKVE